MSYTHLQKMTSGTAMISGKKMEPLRNFPSVIL